MNCVKMLALSSIVASSIYAGSTDIVNGWNLKGASSAMSVTDFSCAKSIWTYNPTNSTAPWNLYLKNAVTGNYNFPVVSSLAQGQGFWVQGENCVASAFNAYGYPWDNRALTDKVADARYLVSGNTVAYANNIFTLTALKSATVQSRTEIKTNLSIPPKKVYGNVQLTVAPTSYNYGQMNVMLKNITLTKSIFGIDSAITPINLWVAINIKSDQANYAIEIQDDTGTLIGTNKFTGSIVSSASLLNKNLDLSIEVISGGLRFVVMDGQTTYSKDYTNTNITFDDIDSLRFRAAVDLNSASGNSTEFKVLGASTGN